MQKKRSVGHFLEERFYLLSICEIVLKMLHTHFDFTRIIRIMLILEVFSYLLIHKFHH